MKTKTAKVCITPMVRVEITRAHFNSPDLLADFFGFVRTLNPEYKHSTVVSRHIGYYYPKDLKKIKRWLKEAGATKIKKDS